MPPKGSLHSELSRAKIAHARSIQKSAIIGHYGITQEAYDAALSKGLRWCRECKKFLHPVEFYGKDPRCIECGKARSKRWRANRGPDKIQADNEYLSGWRHQNKEATQGYRLAKYDVTAEWYAAKLVEQNNCCAICGRERPARRNFCIDHNHTTDQTRGLLCDRCNIFVGMIEKGILDRALHYLRYYDGRPG